MKNGKCPKCNCQHIKIIKDNFHKSGGGNIPFIKNPFLNKHYGQKTFYICLDCGYIEEYLDGLELKKIAKEEGV